MALSSAGGGGDVAGGEGLAQRQQIEQQVHQHTRISRNVPAIRQDLALHSSDNFFVAVLMNLV